MSKKRTAKPAILFSFSKVIWWMIFGLSVGFYFISAWVYYRILQVEPFLGSTVTPKVIDLASVSLGLAKFGLSISSYASILLASTTLVMIACCILGVLVFLRQPDMPIGWIMSLILIWMGTLVPVQAVALTRIYPNLDFLAFFANQIGTIIAIILLWIFPNGKFVPGWSKWTFLVALICNLTGTLFPDGPVSRFVILPIFIAMFLFGIYSQIYRYRRVSGLEERQQTKWVLFALLLSPLAWVIGGLLIPRIFPLLTQSSVYTAPYNLLRLTINNMANLFIPVSIGIAILRYRLWDIDVIIRKTLLYGVLTVILGLVFFGGVTLLQSVFSKILNQKSEISIVISTLVIVGLFNPLRLRLQNAIDRRFYRRKYDAQKTLERFASLARSEVELEQLSDHLLDVVNETVQPQQVTLWLRPAQKSAPVEE